LDRPPPLNLLWRRGFSPAHRRIGVPTARSPPLVQELLYVDRGPREWILADPPRQSCTNRVLHDVPGHRPARLFFPQHVIVVAGPPQPLSPVLLVPVSGDLLPACDVLGQDR